MSDFHANLDHNGLLGNYLEIMEMRNEMVIEIDAYFKQHNTTPGKLMSRLGEIDDMINYLFGPPKQEMLQPSIPRQELENAPKVAD